MLTEEKIKLNYITFCKKLKKYSAYSEDMMNEIGDKIMRASYGMSEDSGAAYPGSMIDIVLNHICTMAFSINENVFKLDGRFCLMKVNSDMLMRVLLLQHIAKAEMYVACEETWKQKKGLIYDYNSDNKNSLKLGEYSLYLCQKYGIKLSSDEYEAIRIIDRSEEDKSLFYMTPLCAIVRYTNSLVNIELKQKYNNSLKKETVEK